MSHTSRGVKVVQRVLGRAESGNRIADCPSDALAVCSKLNPKERAACLSRLLHSSGSFHECRPLGQEAHSEHRSKPAAPMLFADVAGVILNDARDKIVGTVLHDGSLRTLARPIVLPPDLQARQRDHTYAITDKALSSIVPSVRAEIQSMNKGEAPQQQQRDGRFLKQAETPQQQQQPIGRFLKQAKAPQQQQQQQQQQQPNGRLLKKQEEEAQARAQAKADEEEMEKRRKEARSQQGQGGNGGVPQAPPLSLAPPLADGTLAVVTPATHIEARELRQELQRAKPMTHGMQSNLMNEILNAKLRKTDHEQRVQAAPPAPAKDMMSELKQRLAQRTQNPPTAYNQHLIKVGPSYVPVIERKDDSLMAKMQAAMLTRRAAMEGDSQDNEENSSEW